MEPSYVKLYRSGEFEKRLEKVNEILSNCNACPKNCNINRLNNEYSFCLSRNLPIVSSYTLHFGEEPVLSGTNGVGNVFFGNCNLRCIYCQNFEISQNWKVEKDHEVSFERLADIFLELQNKNAHSIGLVSPTHFAPQILKSIFVAVENGLNIPIIYNSNGYDSVEVLKLFDGIIDIYLPDFKYGNNELARKYSYINNYFDSAKNAIAEMYRQTGSKLIYKDNLVKRGLIIRHLVLPNDISESEKVFKFISELDNEIHISLMSQYFPTHKSSKEILLSRTLREREYENAIDLLEKYNLKNGWIQELESHENYRPDFNLNRENPFNN